MLLKGISKTLVVVIVAILVVVAGVSIYYLLVAGGKKEAITLVVLTRHPQDLLNLARDAFLKSDIAKKYNIVDVQFLSLDSGQWRDYLKSHGADVGWGGGPSLFDSLYRDGWLAPLTSNEVREALSKIPDTVLGAPMKRFGSDGNVYWVAQALSSFGIIANNKLLKDYGIPKPSDWSNLTSPEYGKVINVYGSPAIVIANPLKSTSHLRIYEIILEAYGWDSGWKYLTLLAANSKIIDSASDARDYVIRGEFAATIAVDYYGYIAMVQNPNCSFIIPLKTIVNGDPIALFNTSKHPEAAQAFIAWALTDGQRILLDKKVNRLPVNADVWNTPEGQQRTDLKEIYYKTLSLTPMAFNDSDVMKYEYAVARYFKAVLIDAHDQLVEVWKKLVDLYSRGLITQQQFDYYVSQLSKPLTFTDPTTGSEVTFTKDYAKSIASRMASDRTLEQQLMTIWTQKAVERFNSILNELQKIG
ncbi:MAG: extracellular solute-binding protein [Ignisphaera sp.]